MFCNNVISDYSVTIFSQLLRKTISICYSVFKERSFLKEQFPSSSQSQTETNYINLGLFFFLLRKEVIHPHVLVGIPCYDLTPITGPALDGSLLAVRPPALGIANSHGLTGGVYKTRERIHRDVLIRDY